MLAKKYRLPVQSVLKQRGVTRRSRYFFLKIFPAALPYSRFSVVTSASTIKKATRRNQLKRLMYAAAKQVLPKLPVADYLAVMQGDIPAEAEGGIIKELTILTQ